MSLNFDLRNTSLERDEDGEFIWTTHTESVIFAMMAAEVGPVLTEKNFDEFMTRCIIFGRVIGSFDYPGFTADEARPLIGLSTNVFPAKTRTQWMKKLSWIMDRESKGILSSYERHLAESRKPTHLTLVTEELTKVEEEEEK